MIERKSNFWKWFGLVALFHLLAIGIFGLLYEASPAPKPPEQFISLLPEGDVVKGTPGAQKAPKVGTVSAAPATHSPPPVPMPVKTIAPPTPTAVTPPPVPKPVQPKPVVIKPDAPLVALDKPVTPPKPKVKVDLSKLVDGPAVAADKPVTKPKPHLKKPVAVTADTDDAATSDAALTPESHGLSREQIAHELGKKLEDAGIKDANRIGPSGSANSHANSFADFYASIRDQVMNKWQHPNQLNDNAVNPVVQIHVEKDGRVPPESVTLVKSSGDPVYDDSALTAARSLGYLLEPLPDGCPPDIPITFKLTR